MVHSLVSTYRPQGVLFAMDTPSSELHRRALCAEYKAGRVRDEDISKAVQGLVGVIKRTGASVVSIPRYEADDVIASAVDCLRFVFTDIVIVSEDKDLMQLTHPRVFMHKGGKMIGVNQAVERWGVQPHQIPHVQALCGDKVDNIKGLAGVGPKTAAQWIRRYGTVGNVIRNGGDLPPKIFKQLNDFSWKTNLALTTLNPDLDLPIPLKALFNEVRWNLI
jgi:DNA polymerase-1